ncbi:MAG: hypothetical protein CFH06_01388 [Alphaproteobacteria bacterium MarineAlpha3_Bin5]|nr:hypothetical protein [Magnetovibrio sp.]PPR77222.1 MAG: hypothetical protein CFH06_01388 [Alphaproteobacteria bacterium MarineAlpha3_Bin5]
MEITRPVTISKSGEEASERRRQKEERKAHHVQSTKQKESSGWSDAVAVEFNDSLTEITPEIGRLLESLKQEIEPLRQKLEQANIQNSLLKERLKKHIFLPIPNRKEFERKVTYMGAHLDDLSNPPYLLLCYCYGLGLVRCALGRNAMDEALQFIVQTIQRLLLENDIFGSLGGTDFAVIFTAATAAEAEKRGEDIKKALPQHPFVWKDKEYSLNALVGITKIEKEINIKELFLRADGALIADKAPGFSY